MRHSAGLAILVTLEVAGSCRADRVVQSQPRAPIVQPGAPGQPGRAISAEKAADVSRPQFTRGDVAFMQGMIHHHAQAVEMVALIPARTTRGEMRLLGRRIDQSQTDEIKFMQQWLELRGQPKPDLHAHELHGGTLMPGMLTEDEMLRLSAAAGLEFDRLFLEGMIKHHEGALVMVKELIDVGGADQDPDMFTFASEIEADQTAEIARMRALLSEMAR